MKLAEFLRIFPLRAPHLMWFLGAGASASARIPTAYQMIWDFKRKIYCTELRRPVQLFPNLNDMSFRSRLTHYFAEKGGFPVEGSEEEYSFYFLATFPHEQERRRYIDQLVTGVCPSRGHLALAALTKLKLVRTIWTTNFDRLLEDAFTQVLGSTTLFNVATLDTPHHAEQAINEGTKPVLIKLHGDFQSLRLKNTVQELEQQDAELRQCLTHECGRQGLVVVGYSGRDKSVMDAFEQALDIHQSKAYPAGLFWFHRSDGLPFNRAITIIDRAKSIGIDAHLIEVETFDELANDLFTLIEHVPEDLSRMLDFQQRRLTSVEIPPPGESWPVIRMNALPIEIFPSVCRKVVCKIGNTAEVRKAIASASAKVIALRRKLGVICFGSDSEVRRVFDPFGIEIFDLLPIDIGRLNGETAELGLINEAIARALERERPLRAISTRQGWKVFVDPGRSNDPLFNALSKIEGGITGKIRGTQIAWYEAAIISVQRKLERLWLVFEPSIWIDWPEDKERDDDEPDDQYSDPPLEADTTTLIAKEFVRERAARRYNRELIKLMDGWSKVFIGSCHSTSEEGTLRVFGISDGVDAAFKLCRTTAFSRRWRKR